MYIRGVVSLTIYLAVGVQRFQPNLWKADNHNLFKIWIKFLAEFKILCVHSWQVKCLQEGIRDDREEALSGNVKKLEASGPVGI